MCVLGLFCQRCGLLSSVWGRFGRWLFGGDFRVSFGCGVGVVLAQGVLVSTVLMRAWWFVGWMLVFRVLLLCGWRGGLNGDWVDVGLAAVQEGWLWWWVMEECVGVWGAQ